MIHPWVLTSIAFSTANEYSASQALKNQAEKFTALNMYTLPYIS